MKIITLLVLFSVSAAHAQQKGELSVTPFLRMDKYPAFTYASGPVVSYTVHTRGTSPGVFIDYTRFIAKQFYIAARIGYYRYSVNKTERVSNTGLVVHSRPTTLQLLPGAFFTFDSDKYFYNTVCLGAGAGKDFILGRNTRLRTGGFINNYITCSQSYHIDYDHPDNLIENPYKSSKTRYAGVEAGLHCSLLKTTGRCRYGPALLLPVYSLWKTDDVFANETNTGSRSKWLKGVGAGLSFCYSLTAKNK